MVGEGTVCMSVRELKRVHVIRQVIDHGLRQRAAGELLGLTTRQVRRLIQRVRVGGDAALRHQSRGRPSNRRYPPALKAQVLRLYRQHYGDFGPTLAVEKFAERQGLRLSAETLRGWLRAQGVEHFRRRPRPHRAWRARKPHVGALLQMDGSHHAWFEARGPVCVLLAYIDDASSRVAARFYAYEGTVPALDSFRRYVERAGLPQAVYADKHTTYRAPGEPTLEEQLAGVPRQSQFQRALAELGVELIHAHSPQAKGRVERLFKTLQDRLVKELRLANIATIEAANQWLATWLPSYNRRFTVLPAHPADVHRPSPGSRALDRILCVKTTRTVRRDWTVAHHGHLYQLETSVRATQVVVEERLDGRRRITYQGHPLRYHVITARPVRVVTASPFMRPRRPVKPKPTHPWQRRLLRECPVGPEVGRP
jgi:transposase